MLPVYRSVQDHHVETVRLLLNAGADPLQKIEVRVNMVRYWNDCEDYL